MKSKKEKVAESAHAYTPGLKVKRVMRVQKVRRLPLPGEVLVQSGEEVSFDTIVAKTFISGEPHIIRVYNFLGVEPDEIEGYMKKKVGDSVKKGESLAGYSSFFGLLKKDTPSPYDGTVESVSFVTGQAIIRESPVPVEVKAYIPGRVTRVLPKEGVVIETNASFIQGIFGFGGEKHGDLQVLVETPEDVLSGNLINDDHKGKILVGGSLIIRDALTKAVEVGAKGLVAGGVVDKDVIDFLGFEIGVAITGQEDVDITMIISEGFGRMTMSHRTFNLLKSFDGYPASISGVTQIRAGVIRPEIIIPYKVPLHPEKVIEEELVAGMKPGTLVRVIREPYFGSIGRVLSLPVELQKIETESDVRVLEVALEDGRSVIIPRANVEIIEE